MTQMTHLPEISNETLSHHSCTHIVLISSDVSVQLVPAAHPSKEDQGLPSSLHE